MKLRQLRTVLAVAHRGSMRAAADALSLSQPAVTRAIGMVEAELGATLFLRTHAGARSTLAGLGLVEAGVRAFRHLAEIEGPNLRSRAACPPMGPDGELFLASPFLRQVSDHELSALIGVSRAGSTRRAAETLGVTQAAVARSLATLAGRLGRPVYRDRHAARLSDWIDVAAASAQRAFREIAAAEVRLRSRDATPRVLLRIGALPASRVHLVPEATRRFSAHYAASEVAIVDGRYEALLSMLQKGEIDVVVGSIRPQNLPDWTRVAPLMKDHLVVVGRPDHPLQSLPSVDWWDLRSARWVLPGRSTPIRAEFERLVTRNAIPAPAQIVEVDSFVAARSFLLAGDWLGIFSASQILPEERAGMLRCLPMSDLGGGRDVGAITCRNAQTQADLALFLEHLKSVASEISWVTDARLAAARPAWHQN